jgi:DegV family protein with EDD domain
VVIVVTDSCASVPAAMVAELGIEVVAYHVHTVNGTQQDSQDAAADRFYDWLKTAPEWPSTANPSAGEYLEAFRRAAGRGDAIVAISMTGTGSGGFQSASLAARLAAQELTDVPIEVVDTQTVAMAHGWVVIQAARAALQGLDMEIGRA